ncbi:hypothetical protein SCANM63S_04592 [Streptomyces canarius]
MSIEQFIESEVKSNDVVLFMKGSRSFRSAAFRARWSGISRPCGRAV